MMGGESCDGDSAVPAAKRVPRVCLRRKQGAGALHVMVSHGSVDVQDYAFESSAPATAPPAKASGANFSVTRVLPGRHEAAAAAAVATAAGSEARFRISPATPPAAPSAATGRAPGSGVAVRDSGLSNVFDAFEREFERFKHEVQHNYLSQGCEDPVKATLLACPAAVAVSGQTQQLPPKLCRRCGKCCESEWRGCSAAAVRHGLVAATNCCDRGTGTSVAATVTPAWQHGTVAAPAAKHDACPAHRAATCGTITAISHVRVASAGSDEALVNRRRPSTLSVAETRGAAAVASFESPSSGSTPASDALSGSVISLFISEEDEPRSRVDRRQSEPAAATGCASRTCSAAQPILSAQQQQSCGGCCRAAAATAAGDLTSAAAACCSYCCGSGDRGRRDGCQGGFVAGFDATKFQKLKELAANVELDLDLGSLFCTEQQQPPPLPRLLPPVDLSRQSAASAAGLPSDYCTDDETPSCNFTSHHECLRLVASGCNARCASSSTSGTGSGSSCNGGSGRAAATQPSSEQRIPRESSTELHERDDADSGYGGSGGSLPTPQSSSGAAAYRDSGSSKSPNGRSAAAAEAADKSSTVPALARDELCKMIRSYNLRCGSSQLLTMPDGDDAGFSGCIQVCISLSRPISMLLSSRPASIYEALNRPAAERRGNEAAAAAPALPQRVTTAKVSLPKDAVMSLHVSSEHVASDVVQMLLGKFKITDNPQKFALYEQTHVNGVETKLRKLADAEQPLVNFLHWSSSSGSSSSRGTTPETRRFVLKENSSNGSNIDWDVFSVPELLNFLRMLEREEKEYADQIRHKYIARRKHLETALRDATSVASSSSSRGTSASRSGATLKSRP